MPIPRDLPAPPRRRRWLIEAVAALTVLVTILALGGGPARSAAAPLETALQAVFTVHSADDEDRFLGSAFLWQGGDVAVTNAHVVGQADEVRLTDAAGLQQTGRVIARDALRDVAVIAVAPGRTGLPLAPANPALGAEVWALGAPLGIEFTVTEGMISALARQVDPAAPIRMLQHDAAVNPGSSGGPLVDATGALVGMNSQIADGSRMFVGIAYAIPAADLARIVQGLIAETLPPLPQLGLTARPVDRQLAAALGISPLGLLVDAVKEGGLAAVGGLKPGDILLALDGTALHGAGDLPFAIEAAQPKAEADVAVLRDGAVLLITLSLVAEDQAVLGLRDLSGAGPQRVASYSLQGLGLDLGDGGLVRGVTENSPALFAGVAVGDRLLRLNGAVLDRTALDALAITAPVLLLVQGANGATRHVLIDPWATGKTIRPVGGANVLDPDVVVF